MDDGIYLDEALGTYDNMPPKDLAKRWNDWKALYPTAYNDLKASITANPIVVTLDALSAAIATYDQIVVAIAEIKESYATAKAAYETALAFLVSPRGAEQTAKAAVDAQIVLVKNAAKELYAQAKEAAIKAVTLKVPSYARLEEIT